MHKSGTQYLLTTLLCLFLFAAAPATAQPTWPARGASGVVLQVISDHLAQSRWDPERLTVIGELKNVGTVAASDITCDVDLYSGTRFIERRRAIVYINHLAPGETSPVSEQVSLPNGSAIDRIVWHPAGQATTAKPFRPAFRLVQVSERRGHYYSLEGLLCNTSEQTIVVQEVLATFYDRQGRVTGFDKSSDPQPDWAVGPGDTWPFYVHADDVDAIVAYKLQVDAQPGVAAPTTPVPTHTPRPSPTPWPTISGPYRLYLPCALREARPDGRPTLPWMDDQAEVTRVIDGDTIEVRRGSLTQRVRYLGIDTPETVDPNEPAECYGPEASAANKRLVEGRIVRLEKDTSETDRYGRLLRYVWADDTMVNMELVRLGLARLLTFEADQRYYLELLAAQARQRGLWAPGACP